MSQYINKIQQFLNKNISECDIIILLFVWIRKELESSNENNELKTLKFFCDWTLHAKMDRTGSNLIADLQSTIIEYKSDVNNQLIQKIKDVLLTNFKSQLQTFFTTREIITNVLSDETEWNIFLTNLLETLMQTPVILTSITEEKLKTVPLQPEMWITTISIIKNNLGGAINHETYCLKINTSNDIPIIVQLI